VAQVGLLAAGSAASLGANIAVAEPTAYGRVIAAWPSFALIGAYELLMRQIRHVAVAAATRSACDVVPTAEAVRTASVDSTAVSPSTKSVEASSQRSRARLQSPPPVDGRRDPRWLDDADLLARARRVDAEHRSQHDRPASAETLRVQLRVGARSARALKAVLRRGTDSASQLPSASTG
jgi:hypothetical protein